MVIYIRDGELSEIEQRVNAVESWTYSITTTLAQDGLSLGDVYTHHLKGIDKLVRNDAQVRYVLFTCINKDSPRQRPHGHGLIRTTLPEWKVQKLFWGYGTTIRPVYDLQRWLDYCTSQAVSTTTLLNI